MNSFESMQKMLRAFKKADIKPNKHDANFFEVSGYPHYENVVSNILKFLFDTREEHGFNDLWIKSLLHVYNNKNPKKHVEEIGINVINIEREYSNGSDKRIDLLIDCESFLIVIENKIYANLYNDLSLYTRMAKRYENDLPIIGIVLSLKNEQSSINKETGYINITYDELISEVEKNNNDDSNNKWSLFNKEFIDNLRYRSGVKNMKLDEKWLGFAIKNKEQIDKLIAAKNNDRKVRLDILKAINSEIDKNEKVNTLSHGVYNSSNETYISQYNDIPIGNGKKSLCVETYIMVEPPSKKSQNKEQNKEYEKYSYLYISLWCRRDQDYKGFNEALEAIGKSNEARRTKSRGWGYHYILDEIDLTKDINIEETANTIAEYLLLLIAMLHKTCD